MPKLPIVAIVGRPNVGKSTLFNRIVGREEALVEDRPGVTRDRHYAEADWAGQHFTIVDTGGFTEGESDALASSVRRQAEKAIVEALAAILVVDGRDGVIPDDLVLADVVRRSGKPVFVVANKIDDAKGEARGELSSVYAMGFPNVFAVSATHGRGVNDLLDAVLAIFPDVAEEEDGDADDEISEDQDGAAGEDFTDDGFKDEDLVPLTPGGQPKGDGIPRIAVIGRPNAGKSTLLNRLLGDDRLVVSEVPGTTRDAIEVEVVNGTERYRFIDTAGIRRKSAHGDDLERETAALAEASLERADVAIVLFDSTEPAVEQDSRLLGACLKRGRPLVLAANKVDLLSGNEGRKRLREAIDEHLRFVFDNAPLVELSATLGTGLPKLLETCTRLYNQSQSRIGTPEMNRFLREAEDAHPAPRHAGHPVRLYYMAQVGISPPTFLIHVNRPEGITEAYRRFLENRMRDRWHFEIPLRLVFRRRRR